MSETVNKLIYQIDETDTRDFVLKRFKVLADVLGLKDAMPDDKTILSCAGTVLGLFRGKVESLTAELQAAREERDSQQRTCMKVMGELNEYKTIQPELTAFGIVMLLRERKDRIAELESENSELKERNEEIHADLMQYKLPHDEWQNVRNKAITATWQRCREIASARIESICICTACTTKRSIVEAIEKEFTK